MITANFSTYASYVTDSLYQWDLNRVLTISGLNLATAPEVHFANANMDRAIVKQAELKNHVVKVQIPNSLLQESLTIKAHIGIYEGDTFKVVEAIDIPVIPKTRPFDYQIEDTDEEIYSFNKLENEIKNIRDLMEGLDVNTLLEKIEEISPTSEIEEGSVEPVTSGAVYTALTRQSETLGGFTPVIDETGKITGYKTTVGGADTVFPFKRIELGDFTQLGNVNNYTILDDGLYYASSTNTATFYPIFINGVTMGYIVGKKGCVACSTMGGVNYISYVFDLKKGDVIKTDSNDIALIKLT